MLHARGFRGRQLQRIALVVIPAAQVNRLALAAADRHAHHVDEEFQALIGFWSQQFHVAEMGEIENRLGVHWQSLLLESLMILDRGGTLKRCRSREHRPMTVSSSCPPTDHHPPRMRGIQYAAASRINRGRRWNTRSPGQA